MICCNRLITHSHLTQADLAGRGRPAGMAGGAAGYPSAPLVRWVGLGLGGVILLFWAFTPAPPGEFDDTLHNFPLPATTHDERTHYVLLT